MLKYRGHTDASYVDFLEGVIEQLVGSRTGIHLFVDCEEQTGFDAGFRMRVTQFARTFEPRTLTFCILARSRIVAFGVALVRTVLGGNEITTSSRKIFDSHLDRAIRRSTLDAAMNGARASRRDSGKFDLRRTSP
jgi:hypothetical protein